MNIPLCTGNTCVLQNVSRKIPYVKLLLLFLLITCKYIFVYLLYWVNLL